jgi:hypothetical protein
MALCGRVKYWRTRRRRRARARSHDHEILLVSVSYRDETSRLSYAGGDAKKTMRWIAASRLPLAIVIDGAQGGNGMSRGRALRVACSVISDIRLDQAVQRNGVELRTEREDSEQESAKKAT